MADQRVCYKCEWTSSPPIQDHYNGTQLNGFFYHQLGSTLSDIKRHSRNTQLGSLRPCILYMGYIHINKHTHIYICDASYVCISYTGWLRKKCPTGKNQFLWNQSFDIKISGFMGKIFFITSK